MNFRFPIKAYEKVHKWNNRVCIFVIKMILNWFLYTCHQEKQWVSLTQLLKILSHNFKVMVTLSFFLHRDIYSVVNIILIYYPRFALLASFFRLHEPFRDMTKLMVMVTSRFGLPVPIWASRKKKMKMQLKRVWKLSATDNILHAYRLLPNELWLANCKAFLNVP